MIEMQNKPSEIMRFFEQSALPDSFQEVDEAIRLIASRIEQCLSPSAEKTTALRKLLESRDCIGRACTYPDPNAS